MNGPLLLLFLRNRAINLKMTKNNPYTAAIAMSANTISSAMSSSQQVKSTLYDISLQPVCKAHLQQLANHLRTEDRRELIACYQRPVLEGLEYCWRRSSLALSFFYQGQVGAVAGVEPFSLLGTRACVWSWTGKIIEKCPVQFWKVSQRVLAYFLTQYPYLYAACDERYQTAQRYVQKLGALSHGKPVYLADKTVRFYLYQFTPKVLNHIKEE